MSDSEQKQQPYQRTIRSFVRRQGRLTHGQEHALETHWPTFGIEYQKQSLNLEAVFGNKNPVTLEIGFGNGNSLAEMAAAAPERNFLGIEVHTPGVGHLLQRIGELGLSNLRLMHHDAVEVLKDQLQDDSLNRFQLFFPDPWHKKKHQKRRIVQSQFMDQIANKLQSGGKVHMATDWQHYAEQMAEVLEAHPLFENLADEGLYVPRPEERPLTKFEQRGQRLGHGIWDLLYRRM
ncbi:MAG: tRNA (guanosine(46)-N7)-methyltransferase TrmB [Gammaproteobacteria bacterium]|nr:tRNA (guanosine(46)-N7)-methyltransferase TrmB [Gammaproteobacteria bacterium]